VIFSHTRNMTNSWNGHVLQRGVSQSSQLKHSIPHRNSLPNASSCEQQPRKVDVQQPRQRRQYNLVDEMPQRIDGPFMAAEPLPPSPPAHQIAKKLRPPPGLPPPPGLAQPLVLGTLLLEEKKGCASAAFQATKPSSPAKACAASAFQPGVDVISAGEGTCDVIWRIDKLHSKLKKSRGFPVLSQNISVLGVPEFRLMFAPGKEWQTFPSDSKPRRHSPAEVDRSFGSLRLKTGGVDGQTSCLRFQVFLGSTSAAPSLDCDLLDRNVHSRDLQVDWREHLEDGCDNLQLRVRLAW